MWKKNGGSERASRTRLSVSQNGEMGREISEGVVKWMSQRSTYKGYEGKECAHKGEERLKS